MDDKGLLTLAELLHRADDPQTAPGWHGNGSQ